MLQNVKRRLRDIRIRREIMRLSNHQEGRIAITGCGRSGTKYVAELFRTVGYSLGHESMERHGISSWCLAPETGDRLYGPSPRDLASLDIPYVHQVRHPLKVISSIATARDKSWRFIAKFIPIEAHDSLPLKCMKYWYYWNLLAEQRAKLTYRVEDIERALPRLIEIGGFDKSRFAPAHVQAVRKDVNRRPHESLSWESVEAENTELADRIKALATRYGYEVS